MRRKQAPSLTSALGLVYVPNEQCKLHVPGEPNVSSGDAHSLRSLLREGIAVTRQIRSELGRFARKQPTKGENDGEGCNDDNSDSNNAR